MNKELENICSKNLYEKIYKILESKTIRPSLAYKDFNLTKVDFDNLKSYTEEKIMMFLYREDSIPGPLLKLSEILGTDHMNNLKFTITNYIISQESADLTQFISQNFTNLSSLRLVYKYFEEIIEKINLRYDNLPSLWNLELKMVIKAFIMIKQRICDYFFTTETDEETYVKGLCATISIERKLKQFFIAKKCCVCAIEFKNDDIHSGDTHTIINCLHMKMLSTVFLPYVELYFKHQLKIFTNMKFNQNSCEMNIMNIFLLFFKEVGSIYEDVSYFDDESIFRLFLDQTNVFLIELIKKIKIEEKLESVVTVLSTIVYIHDTLQDLIEKIYEDCCILIGLEAFDVLRGIEKYQSYKLERIINMNFISLKRTEPNFENLRVFFEIFILNFKDLSEDIKNTLIETAMSQLFARISLIKMNQRVSQLLLNDVSDLEEFLLSKYSKIPHAKTIKEYLKIFICPTDDKQAFVNNFIVLANSMFSFYQILNALENQEDAEELFIIYKKTVQINE